MTTNDSRRATPEATVDASEGPIPHSILASTTPVAFYGYSRVKKERLEDFLREIRAVIGLIREETGCEEYTVGATEGDACAFTFYERWSTGADLLAHVSQPFMHKYFAAVAELSDGEGVSRWMKPIAA
ncbi:putative quinol monooxygenase [Streptomyces cyaneofuscatus]|uniref:putative quinol monooxygenase n=1 Tax=Streptomyces cyaneofuscatus TaxID=66883 RepID=UPI003799101A